MKHMKKLMVLALVIVTVLAITVPAMAAYRPWQYRWGPHTILPYSYPPAGSDERAWIANLQGDLNTLRTMYTSFTHQQSPFRYSPLTVDGLYGPNTISVIEKVQGYYSLVVDGYCGVNTKNAIWNGLGFTPVAD